MLTSWAILILSLALSLVIARVQYLERQVKRIQQNQHENMKHYARQIGGILSVLGTMNGIDVDAILAEGQEK